MSSNRRTNYECLKLYIVFVLQAEQREVETANAMLESEVKNVELQVQRKLFEQV